MDVRLVDVPRRALHRATRPIARRHARAKLRAHAPRLPAPILAALESTLDGAATSSERAWIARIEALRGELTRSADTIETSRSLWTDDPSAAGMHVEVVGEVCRIGSKPRPWALLLLRLVRELGPRSCIELGTAVGISAAYQAAGLELNGDGRLVTLEKIPGRAAVAREGLARLGLERVELRVGEFADTLRAVVDEIAPIDFAFVDGHHDEHATLRYFEELLRGAAGGSTIVLDDIAWSDGMRRAWKRASSHPRVDVAIDLGPMGLCLIGAGCRADPMTIRLPV